MSVQFEWNQGEAASNLRKHGVSFGELSRIFRDGWQKLKSERLLKKNMIHGAA